MEQTKRYSCIFGVALFLLASCSFNSAKRSNSSDSHNISGTNDTSVANTDSEFYLSSDTNTTSEESLDSPDDSSELSESSIEEEKKQHTITFIDCSFNCEEDFAYLDLNESTNYIITDCLSMNGEYEDEAILAFYTNSPIESVRVFAENPKNIDKGIFIGLINAYGIFSLYKSNFDSDSYFYAYSERTNATHIAIRTVETVIISKIVLTLKNV